MKKTLIIASMLFISSVVYGYNFSDQRLVVSSERNFYPVSDQNDLYSSLKDPIVNSKTSSNVMSEISSNLTDYSKIFSSFLKNNVTSESKWQKSVNSDTHGDSSAVFDNGINKARANFETLADIDQINKFGNTLLTLSCEYGNLDSVKRCVESGANVNKIDRLGNTPLCIACSKESERVETNLVKHDAHVEAGSKKGSLVRYSAKSYANFEAFDGEKNILGYLVEQGANVNLADRFGRTPLSIACSMGSMRVVKHLVEQGADINRENQHGQTPLLEACQCNHEDIVKYLVERGADVNVADEFGKTPLFWAHFLENEALVEWLVGHGASVNAADELDETYRKPTSVTNVNTISLKEFAIEVVRKISDSFFTSISEKIRKIKSFWSRSSKVTRLFDRFSGFVSPNQIFPLVRKILGIP